MPANQAPWQQADADAHEAKADALEHAEATLAGVLPIMDAVGRSVAGQALTALEAERRRHDEAAALIRGRAAA